MTKEDGPVTVPKFAAMKAAGQKISMLTAYDYATAGLLDAAGVDGILVGDSLAMVAHGHPSTIPATMDMMVMHAQAVRRGAPNTFVLGCMPYQSYSTVERALTTASRFMQEALCDAVKPQGKASTGHAVTVIVQVRVSQPM